MNLEEYFFGLTFARNKVNESLKALDNAIEEEKKLSEKYEQEYIRDNAKFKVGDEVRYANSPNGKKFIVKDIICVNYSVFSSHWQNIQKQTFAMWLKQRMVGNQMAVAIFPRIVL